MPAATYNLDGDSKIEQGATYVKIFTWKVSQGGAAIDLTGCTARMQIRDTLAAASAAVNLTTENGGIILGGVDGTITITISATQTAALTATSGVYDLEIITAGGSVKRLLKGNVSIDKEVTR